MFKHMGGVAWGVTITLLLMSVISIGIMIERWYTYSQATKQSRKYAPEVARLLKQGKIKEAIDVSHGVGVKHSHLAKVLVVGLQEWQYQQETGEAERDKDGAVDAAKRAIQRATAVNLADLKRGLSGLATIGSTAPFVGLFGTTFGIINAFSGMAVYRLRRHRRHLGRHRRGPHHHRLRPVRGGARGLGLQLPGQPRGGLQRRDGQLQLGAARLLHQEGRVGPDRARRAALRGGRARSRTALLARSIRHVNGSRRNPRAAPSRTST